MSRCSAPHWNCWCCGEERTSGVQSLHVSCAAVAAAPSASESVEPLQGPFSVSGALAAGCSDTASSAAPVRRQTAPTCVSDSPEFDPERSAGQLLWLRCLSAWGPCVGPLLLQLPHHPLSSECQSPQIAGLRKGRKHSH